MGCSVSIPMRKLSTGEPYARKSLVRFGGRGDFFPTPIGKIEILEDGKDESIIIKNKNDEEAVLAFEHIEQYILKNMVG